MLWSKTTRMVALFTIALYGSGVEASKTAKEEVTYQRLRPQTETESATTESKATKSKKSPTSKKGEIVCLEYGFLNEVVVAGSPESNPVGTAGPTGAGACVPGPGQPSGLCCTDFAACTAFSPDDCDAYLECLRDPANGPVLVGDWWLQQSVSNGEMFFEEDAVCGRITSDELNSRTRAELWDDTYKDMDLSLFKKFSAGYDFRSTGRTPSSGGYLEMYLRVDGSSIATYDCRLVFEIPNEEGTGTLLVTPQTIGTSNQYNPSSGTPGNPTPGNTNGCPDNEQISIQDYLGDNPDAVMGVGIFGSYTYVLNGGSEGENNAGQLICWSDVSIQIHDETGAIQVQSFEFTTL